MPAVGLHQLMLCQTPTGKIKRLMTWPAVRQAIPSLMRIWQAREQSTQQQQGASNTAHGVQFPFEQIGFIAQERNLLPD